MAEATARYYLGVMNLEGQGGKRNLQKAYEYFIKSEQDDKDNRCEYWIGILSLVFEGDKEKANKWLKMSAEGGNSAAIEYLNSGATQNEDLNKIKDIYTESIKIDIVDKTYNFSAYFPEGCIEHPFKCYFFDDIWDTTCGLTEIKGADDPVNWKRENLTYERRCHGYSSVLEYYEKEKDKINFYSSVTGFFCRGMMYVSMMVKDNYKNVRKEMLLEGKKFVDERCQKEDYSSEIHITVLRTVLNKLIEDIDKECFDKEAHEADIMLDRIMQQRQRCFDEYRYYKE